MKGRGEAIHEEEHKRLDPALLNELIDELIAQAGSDNEQICEFTAGIAEAYLAAQRGLRDR